MAVPHQAVAAVGKLQALHCEEKRLGLHLDCLRKQLPRTRSQDIRQWIVDLVGLTQRDNVDILAWRIALLERFWMFFLRLDTPPISFRHHPVSRIQIIIPPDRHDEELGILERVRHGERIKSYETVRMRKDGSLLDVSLTVSPLRDAAGRIIGASKIARDITQRKRAEETLRQSTEALRRSEAYLAEAQRLSHTGTWVSDGTLTTVYNSEENYRIWGVDPLQGLPSREAMWQRIHPDDRGRVWEGVQEAVRQKRDYAGEFRIVLPDGTIKYLEVTAHHRFSASGELVEIVGTHVDVTERKRAQEEHERLRRLESDLAHMNRLSMMGELAASLAHEITQPIAAARNNARAALNFLDEAAARPGRDQGSARLLSSAMPIEPEISSTGSVITSRKRLRERIVSISMRRSTR